MTSRHVLAAGFLLAATASVAQAQAPGEVLVVVPAAPAVQPMQPVYVVAPAAQQVDPLRHRFSVGLNMGGLNLGEDGNEFSIAELAIRYRLNRRIEIELSSFGGVETTGEDYYDDYDDSYDATGSLAIGARYRFLPERKLNWYASAAIGGAIVAPHNASDDTIANSQRGLFMLGLGGEWRFRPHWALQAEARLVSLSPLADTEEAYPDTARVTGDGTGGGMFTLGLSIYL
jgi:hypothetical protein